jgi:hypothetical protein
MKATVTLTDENAACLAWAVKLIGLSLEEIVNLCRPTSLRVSDQTAKISTSKTL